MKIQATWAQLKTFFDNNKPLAALNHIDLGETIHIWCDFRGAMIEGTLYKTSEDEYNDFINNYYTQSNKNEAEKIRVTNCKIGRKLHDRYVSFITSKASDNMDNTDYNDQDYGDMTYTMRDINKQITTVEADCKETWIDFEPKYNYEVSSGYLYVPATVTSSDWEVHIVGVPDLPANLGGSVNFIANPRLKWNAGQYLFLDSSLNPAELLYNATYHTNKIRIILKHPLGAQEEFQFNIKVFK